jgi:hypothetical protein
MDRVRIRLNNASATEAVRLGGGYVEYPELIICILSSVLEQLLLEVEYMICRPRFFIATI